jgi:phenylalanyl-tRNA synthetase beta chain
MVEMALIKLSIEELSSLSKVPSEKLEENLTLLGVPVEKIEGDEINLEITPNRPDMLCVEGVARALSCFVTGKPKKYEAKKSGYVLDVDGSVADVRPVIGMAVVRGVQMNENVLLSLIQLQEKLHETLGRKRKKVAIGVHDISRIRAPFRYFACKRDGISFVPLGGNTAMTPGEMLQKQEKGIAYAHLVGELCPMITDKDGNVLSFPPIINGELTRVGEQSTDLLIDATGTSEVAVRQAVNILAAMLSDRGGKVETIRIAGKEYAIFEEKEWKLPHAFICKLLGVQIPKDKMKKMLSKLGHRIVGEKVFSPGYRTDVMHEADLAEDVAIAYDYNKFEPKLPDFATVGRKREQRKFHDLLLSMGFLEARTWILTNRKMLIKANSPPLAVVDIENPLTVDFEIVRPSLLPNILAIFGDSKNEKLPQKIYEEGTVARPKEESHLAVAVMQPKAAFSQIRGIAEKIIGWEGMKVSIKEANHPTFIDGRCCAIINEKDEVIGFFGEVHPEVLVNFGLEQPVVALEMKV